jgi:anthranilate synthase component 2
MHGKISPVFHQQEGIFRGLPSPFNATRYHSLIVERASFPESLQVTAATADGLIMGLQHRSLPLHGVQFHPESIASEQGHPLLKNFLELAK